MENRPISDAESVSRETTPNSGEPSEPTAVGFVHQIPKYLALAATLALVIFGLNAALSAILILPIALWSRSLWTVGCACIAGVVWGLQSGLAVPGETVLPVLLLVWTGFLSRRQKLIDVPNPLRTAGISRYLSGGLAAVLVIGMCTYRQAPVVPIVAWTAVYGVMTASLPRLGPGSMRRLVLSMGAILWIALVTLGLLEIGIRLVIEPRDPILNQYNFLTKQAEYGYTLRPGSAGDVAIAIGEEKPHEFHVAVSKQGLRDREYPPKAENEFRILMLGDSQTMGHGVEWDQTIGQCLERYLNAQPLAKHVQVVNGGVSGYAPWQERGFLHDRGFPFEPDLVILQVFPDNDVGGSLKSVGRHLRAYNPEFDREMLFYWDMPAWQVDLENRLRQYWRTYARLTHATGKSRLLSRALGHFRPFPVYLPPEMDPSEPRPPFLEVFLSAWYPELDEAWQRFQDDVLAIQSDCQARGVDFMAYAVPSPHVASDKVWARITRDFPPGMYDRSKDVRLTEQFFIDAGLPYVDVSTAVKHAPDPESLYFKQDGHLNPRGAEWVAEYIGRNLVADYFLRKLHDDNM